MTGAASVFQTVFTLHYPAIHRYFCACFNRAAAEDLSQSVFAALWKQMQNPDFDEPDNWRAWIFRAAVNRKNDYLRHQLRREPTVSLYEETDHAGADEGEETDLRLSVQAAMRALKEADREILLLKQLGFSSEESGELLGISASAARSRLAKAKERFQEKLAERGVMI